MRLHLLLVNVSPQIQKAKINTTKVSIPAFESVKFYQRLSLFNVSVLRFESAVVQPLLPRVCTVF